MLRRIVLLRLVLLHTPRGITPFTIMVMDPSSTSVTSRFVIVEESETPSNVQGVELSQCQALTLICTLLISSQHSTTTTRYL